MHPTSSAKHPLHQLHGNRISASLIGCFSPTVVELHIRTLLRIFQLWNRNEEELKPKLELHQPSSLWIFPFCISRFLSALLHLFLSRQQQNLSLKPTSFDLSISLTSASLYPEDLLFIWSASPENQQPNGNPSSFSSLPPQVQTALFVIFVFLFSFQSMFLTPDRTTTGVSILHLFVMFFFLHSLLLCFLPRFFHLLSLFLFSVSVFYSLHPWA